MYNIRYHRRLVLQLIWDDFTWRRPAARRRGFAWVGTGEDLCLAPVPGADLRPYRPHPGIFRDFAGLGQTPAAVLDFANRYGPLRLRLELNPFPFWLKGIRHMAELVRLGDAVAAGDWQRMPGSLEPFLADPALAGADDLRPIRQKQERGEKVSRDEQAHAAVARLCHAVWPPGRLGPEGAWNPLTGKVELRLRPNDLLGFMFLQLGGAVLGGRRFRQCPVCGKWSLLTPGVNRADRVTCSGYCRLKLYRRRKARALELHRRGWSPARIAKEIGSDVSKVKAWVSQAQG
jgi:hypothetical protein